MNFMNRSWSICTPSVYQILVFHFNNVACLSMEEENCTFLGLAALISNEKGRLFKNVLSLLHGVMPCAKKKT